MKEVGRVATAPHPQNLKWGKRATKCYLGGGLGARDLDDGQGNLDAHLVVNAAGLGASVLLVGATTVAAAVIEDGDDGGAA